MEMNNLNKNKDSLTNLKSLLQTLFQLDVTELDFGIYRIMNYRRKEIEKFIEKDLIQAVEKEFKRFRTQSIKELLEKIEEKKKEIVKLERELGEKIFKNDDIEEKFKDKPFAKEYLELKKQLDQVEITESIKIQVFNDLYNFFSRYYEDGDFISKRRYSSKQEKYAIPYNGEEVKLYWANFDQYYIKTGEIFKDYEFKLKDWRFIFRTVIAEVESGNVKGERRYFVLSEDEPIKIDKENRTCIIRFEYKQLSEDEFKKYPVKTKSGEEKETGIKQDEINGVLKDRVLEQIKSAELKAILLEKKKINEDKEETFIENNLKKYTKRVTSDFFIHKNLKDFLERELDYFIKTEVIDINNLDERHIARAKVVEGISKRIIEFLAQIENFQKMLWEKKKFVLRTNYVISLKTLKRIISVSKYNSVKEEVVRKILESEKYRDEITNVIGETFKQPGNNIFVRKVQFKEKEIEITYMKRFTKESEFKEYHQKVKKKDLWFKKVQEKIKDQLQDCWYVSYESDNFTYSIDYSNLYIDTKYFDIGFKEDLLEEITKENSLDSLLNGVLIKSENWQALKLISENFKSDISCIYLDPPYNTGTDDFLYKDRYQHSSWLSMMYDRLNLARDFLMNEGSLYISIDWNESHELKKLLDLIFSEENFQREIIWNTGENISGFKSIAPNWIRQHDTVYFYSKYNNKLIFNKLWKPLNIKLLPNWLDIIGPDKQSLFIEKWVNGKLEKVEIKNLEVKPLGDVWNDILSFQYSEPRVTESWFFDTQKVENLLRRIIQSSTQPKNLVMDFFAGSGTTIAVAHKLDRKWIGIEIGDYFENKNMIRIKSVIIGEKRTHLSRDINWQGGGFFKYHYLEQYEDTLHNIEFLQAEKGQKALELFGKSKEANEYLMKYFLKYETDGSQSLLNLKNFENPFEYKLKIISNGKGEEVVNVDLIETFNYLIGLKINKYKFLKENGRKYVFVLGEKNHRKIAVVWRQTKNIDLKKDKEIIKETIKNFNPEEIFINGDALVENYKLIEKEFKAAMGV